MVYTFGLCWLTFRLVLNQVYTFTSKKFTLGTIPIHNTWSPLNTLKKRKTSTQKINENNTEWYFLKLSYTICILESILHNGMIKWREGSRLKGSVSVRVAAILPKACHEGPKSTGLQLNINSSTASLYPLGLGFDLIGSSNEAMTFLE